jgi:hypothetical protein
LWCFVGTQPALLPGLPDPKKSNFLDGLGMENVYVMAIKYIFSCFVCWNKKSGNPVIDQNFKKSAFKVILNIQQHSSVASCKECKKPNKTFFHLIKFGYPRFRLSSRFLLKWLSASNGFRTDGLFPPLED